MRLMTLVWSTAGIDDWRFKWVFFLSPTRKGSFGVQEFHAISLAADYIYFFAVVKLFEWLYWFYSVLMARVLVQAFWVALDNDFI